jgi:hypothetical protein
VLLLTVVVVLPECDALCLWLARYPIQDNHPRAWVHPKAWYDGVLAIRGDELLVDVFKNLTDDGFLGCPVVDLDNMYLNQVDVLDILFYVCHLFKTRQLAALDQHTALAHTVASRHVTCDTVTLTHCAA